MVPKEQLEHSATVTQDMLEAVLSVKARTLTAQSVARASTRIRPGNRRASRA